MRTSTKGQHTEDQLVLLAGSIGDLHICTVQSAQRDRTVQHELHESVAKVTKPFQRGDKLVIVTLVHNIECAKSDILLFTSPDFCIFFNDAKDVPPEKKNCFPDDFLAVMPVAASISDCKNTFVSTCF